MFNYTVSVAALVAAEGTYNCHRIYGTRGGNICHLCARFSSVRTNAVTPARRTTKQMPIL